MLLRRRWRLLYHCSTANAFIVSDGLDGLSNSLPMVCSFAFLVLQSIRLLTISFWFCRCLDWVSLCLSLLQRLSSQIYLGCRSARLGATLAVRSISQNCRLAIIGGVYIFIILSSLVQIFPKKILRRKKYSVAPLHMWFKTFGLAGSKKLPPGSSMAGIIFAIFGLWLSLLN